MTMLEDLHPLAVDVAAGLRQRGETIAVIDGATGGLVSAALLTVPGALDFYVGGGVVYSLRARDILFAQPRDHWRGMRGASEDYALAQARAVQGNFGADWGFAESGSVGGSKHPTGAASGRSVAALIGPAGECAHVTETGSDARIANMEAFARAALHFLADSLKHRD